MARHADVDYPRRITSPDVKEMLGKGRNLEKISGKTRPKRESERCGGREQQFSEKRFSTVYIQNREWTNRESSLGHSYSCVGKGEQTLNS